MSIPEASQAPCKVQMRKLSGLPEVTQQVSGNGGSPNAHSLAVTTRPHCLHSDWIFQGVLQLVS